MGGSRRVGPRFFNSLRLGGGVGVGPSPPPGGGVTGYPCFPSIFGAGHWVFFEHQKWSRRAPPGIQMVGVHPLSPCGLNISCGSTKFIQLGHSDKVSFYFFELFIFAEFHFFHLCLFPLFLLY